MKREQSRTMKIEVEDGTVVLQCKLHSCELIRGIEPRLAVIELLSNFRSELRVAGQIYEKTIILERCKRNELLTYYETSC